MKERVLRSGTRPRTTTPVFLKVIHAEYQRALKVWSAGPVPPTAHRIDVHPPDHADIHSDDDLSLEQIMARTSVVPGLRK
jgi:hypothetical protein